MEFTDGGLSIDYKNDDKANKWRESGNNEFIKKSFLNALIFYNKSISYAKTKQVLSLGYGNRSAVYIELDCFDECLKNIEWARENDYPTNKSSKLDTRELKCKKLMLEGKKYVFEDPWNFFKLSYPANKKIPWIVDCLELRTTEKYGRGVYTTQDLKPGDIICVEEPVVHTLTDEGFYKHCNNCFKTCLLNLIPCRYLATMMFCSIDCLESFHSKSFEVKLAMEDDMKLLSEIAAPFGGYQQLDNFINKKNLKDLKKTIFDYDLSNPEDPDYRKKLILCLLSLQVRGKFSMKEHVLDIFDYVTRKTALHIFDITASNYQVAAYQGEDYNFTYRDGVRLSLFQQLVNHSCLSNVYFIAADNKLVAFVTRPIKANEQIFECYYNKYDPEYRNNKEKMMKHYKFKCDCQECVDNSFKLYDDICVEIANNLMSRKNFNTSKKLLKYCWKNLNTSNVPQVLFGCEGQSKVIMYELAYYVTYPC